MHTRMHAWGGQPKVRLQRMQPLQLSPPLEPSPRRLGSGGAKYTLF